MKTTFTFGAIPGLLFAALMATASAGCATRAMKGTPLYEGEYSRPQGPAEDRVALWPLFYYREPAASLLWPVGEYVKGDGFALRPLFSIHDMTNENRRLVNVLWPLYQHDNADDSSRLLPFFWSDDYFVGFPLYWHFGKKDGCSDLLFPLWWYERVADDRSLCTLLGLAGYSDRGARRSNRLLPLWYYERDTAETTFLSLPWSQYKNASGDAWQLAFPLFFNRHVGDERAFVTLLGGRYASADSSGWVAPLLLSGGRYGTRDADTWLLAGLSHWGRHGDARSSHLFPLYYAASDGDRHTFLSLPWSRVREADGDGWQLVPPVYFGRRDHESSLTLSPLYCASRDKDGGKSWELVPPVYFHRDDGDRHLTLTPLYSAGRDDHEGSSWNTLLPLYYSERDRDGSFFATLLGGHRSGTDGDDWLIYPLLTWNSRHGSTNDFWALAPLAHFRSAPEGGSSHVFPLYYRNAVSGSFLSLPYARWAEPASTNTLIPPLLSLRTAGPDRDELWLLGGLGRLSSGPKARASYLLPLYYGNAQTGLRLSPLYCSWKDGDGRTTLIPPLLSSVTKSGDGTTDVNALLGLVGGEWNASQTVSHRVLPLYAYARSNYFYTPVAGQSRGIETNTYYLTPLLGTSSSRDESSFWLFPLYNRTDSTKNDDYRSRFLWAFNRRAGQTSRSTFFPLYGYDNHGPITDDPPDAKPYARQGRDFLCLPWCWYTDERTHTAAKGAAAPSLHYDTYSHGAFPLWSYRRNRSPASGTRENTSVLLLLYDSKRETSPLSGAPGGTNDYRRQRVLWHVWHYEKLNGDVSVDMLPGITYDAKTDGFRQYSMLWRLFRWQRDAEGKRKLDLLFLPLIRD